MKIQLLNPQRPILRCDRCGSTDSIRECFLPYSARARTCDPGRGKFYDLCLGCRRGLEADPRPYAPPGDLPPFQNAVVQARQTVSLATHS